MRHIMKFNENTEETPLKKEEVYMAALPMDSERKNRAYIKVKYLGKSKDGEIIVSPIEEFRFMADGRTNSFGAGKHYITSMEFMLTSTFAPIK